jgi:hypothetical protein
LHLSETGTDKATLQGWTLSEDRRLEGLDGGCQEVCAYGLHLCLHRRKEVLLAVLRGRGWQDDARLPLSP